MHTITIGVFDGVHLGHQKLFHTMQALGTGSLVAVTFENHPQEYFTKEKIPLLFTPKTKIHFLREYGIDQIEMLPFDSAIANMDYVTFLDRIQDKYPFTSLVLGENADFGKNETGLPHAVMELGKQKGFEVHYIPKLELDRTVVSSTEVRSLAKECRFSELEKRLGRPFGLLYEKETTPLLPAGEYEVTIAESIDILHINDKRRMHFQDSYPLYSPVEFIRRLS